MSAPCCASFSPLPFQTLLISHISSAARSLCCCTPQQECSHSVPLPVTALGLLGSSQRALSRCCPWLPCTSQFSLARSDRARWVTALMHREREQPDTTPRGGTGVQIPPFCPVCTRSCLRGSWGHIDGEEESSGYRALLVRRFSCSDISLFLTQSTNTFCRRDRRKPGGGLGCSSASHTHAGQGRAGQCRKLGLHWPVQHGRPFSPAPFSHPALQT